MSAIHFETVTPRLVQDPERMDVACVVGFIAERSDAPLPAALVNALVQGRLARPEDLTPGRPDRLLGRPVAVESAAELDALFDPDARLDGPAEVAGRALPAALPEGIDPGLDLVVEGRSYRLDFHPTPATPAQLLSALRSSGAPVSARLDGPPVAPHLVLARADTLRPGRLTVLANPGYGFEQAQGAESRAVGCPLGQALRAFFAGGGRRAYVLRMGDPLPYLSRREQRRRQLYRLLLGPTPPAALDAPLLQTLLAGELPNPRQDVADWYGPAQLFGLTEASYLLLPDLPELVSPPPPEIIPPAPGPAPREVFSPCVATVPVARPATAAGLPPPRVDAEGLALWRAAAGRALELPRRHARDKLLLLAVPLAGPGIVLDAAALGVADRPGDPQGRLASAFLQLAEPWLVSAQSRTLPGGLLPPDGPLAGLLAANALTRGAFLTAAGRPQAPLVDLAPDPVTGLEALSRFARTPQGIQLDADHTSSSDPAWRAASVSRLLALLVRIAQDMGGAGVFEPASERLWRDLRVQMETWLSRVQTAGGLAGLTPAEGFRVRCDRSTMSQADRDNGRLIVEVTLLPARPMERIHVALALGAGPVAGAPT